MESLRQGDVLEVLQTLESESVDLVFADPPFNVGIKYAGKASNDDRADYPEWCAAWIAECFRVLKPTGTFYLMTITRHLEHIYPSMKTHGVFINQVNWRNVASTNGKRCFWNEYQPILVYGKTDEYKFHTYAQTRKPFKFWSKELQAKSKGQMMDYWDDIALVYAGSIIHPEAILKPDGHGKAHPAQMPIALPERAILFSTDECDTVLDPFNGSGTTGEACMKHNRHFIGIERESEYVELSLNRWAKARLSPTFFTPSNNRLQPTAFGVGTQAEFPLLGGNQADESPAKNGGG